MLKQTEAFENDDALELSMVAIAAAMSETSRMKMLCAMMDGRAWTATELSAVAEVVPSTASAHLARLLSGGLISCLSQGRHRYYRLAGNDVAGLIETLMGISWQRTVPPVTRAPVGLRTARTCYDHLAGDIAVKIYSSMISQSWIDTTGTIITSTGAAAFLRAGISLDAKTRRKPCCACLDWSERRFHLGGHAGAAFLTGCEQYGWLTRTPGFREVTITPNGKRAFRRLFGIDC